MSESGDRMFASLPAMFRNRDETGDLTRLLGVLEEFFFTGGTAAAGAFPGLEQCLEKIPALFSPMGESDDRSQAARTPDRFLHWLATWLSFTPHALFPPETLRRIIGGIVPMYGFRGTRDYLVRLLELCLGDMAAHIHVDDRPSVGFTIGGSTVGVDTRLAVSRPFCFKVFIEGHERPAEQVSSHEAEALQNRVRAVIDFAKPAHTIYELEWRAHPHSARRRDDLPVTSGRSS